jgi:hypothetical protein
MSNQLAKLFLRGSLMNETAKQLTRYEIEQVDKLMKEAWEDPNIQGQKMEFCLALGRTIGNEYKDVKIGEQDCYITFWKAAVMVLFHESKQCSNNKCREHFVTSKTHLEQCTKCGNRLDVKWTPKPQIAEDPVKRKKFFQSVMFNYLKQILRENKPHSYKEIHTEDGNAPDVAVTVITKYLDRSKISEYDIVIVDDNNTVIKCETGLIPLKTIQKISNVISDFEEHGVKISANWNSINIVSVFGASKNISYKIVDKVYTKFTSLDSGSDNEDSEGSYRDHYEHKALQVENKFEHFSESMQVLRSRLSDDARKLFDLIVDTPDDYKEKFGTDKLHRANMAKYLGKDIKEIDSMKDDIKMHCLALNIGIGEAI